MTTTDIRCSAWLGCILSFKFIRNFVSRSPRIHEFLTSILGDLHCIENSKNAARGLKEYLKDPNLRMKCSCSDYVSPIPPLHSSQNMDAKLLVR